MCVYRRGFISLVSIGAVLSGCVEMEGAGFESDNDPGTDAEDAGDEDTEDEPLNEFRDVLQEFEVEVLELRVEEEEIVLDAQTSGNIDTDIQRIASAYATMAPDLTRDLSVRMEDRGLTETTFEIELDWAQQSAEGRMPDEEFVDNIRETMPEDR